jgi:Fe-S oxidoreductase
MTDSEKRMNRLGWVTDDMKVATTGEVLFFVGCAPFFDVFFDDLGVNTLQGVTSAVKLLNRIDIDPVLMEDERCCGHDLLWTGDEASFKELAALNVARIEKTGAKIIITGCPECYRTLALDYPAFGFDHGLKVMHISEIIAENLESDPFELGPVNETVTFQDPCRLGRHMGVYDAPRSILSKIPDLQFKEMMRNRNMATCCGTNAWVNCDVNSKQIQVDHLKEAKDMGCDLLLTACPKCEIHYRCAMKDTAIEDDIQIELTDIASIAERSASQA